MNYLAHILVSKKDIDYQLGNLLADPLKSKLWDNCNSSNVEGIKMHGSIDAFTDSNPYVKLSKSRLGEKGYLKGVVIDIAFDHFLLKHWNQYVAIDSESFINRFHDEAIAKSAILPAEAKKFITRIISNNILSSYGELEGLETAFERIDNRLSPRILAKESASSYFPVLESSLSAIENDFLQFFPELVSHFKEKSGVSAHECWLK